MTKQFSTQQFSNETDMMQARLLESLQNLRVIRQMTIVTTARDIGKAVVTTIDQPGKVMKNLGRIVKANPKQAFRFASGALVLLCRCADVPARGTVNGNYADMDADALWAAAVDLKDEINNEAHQEFLDHIKSYEVKPSAFGPRFTAGCNGTIDEDYSDMDERHEEHLITAQTEAVNLGPDTITAEDVDEVIERRQATAERIETDQLSEDFV